MITDHEFSGLFESFIAANFEHDTSLTNLADLVAWNQANANMAMPERKSTIWITYLWLLANDAFFRSLFWSDRAHQVPQ